MASWDDYYHIPESWNETESELYFNMVGDDVDLANDRTLQFLYDGALFNEDLNPEDRAAFYWALEEYLWDEYGMDMDDYFDWESYREWYEAA